MFRRTFLQLLGLVPVAATLPIGEKPNPLETTPLAVADAEPPFHVEGPRGVVLLQAGGPIRKHDVVMVDRDGLVHRLGMYSEDGKNRHDLNRVIGHALEYSDPGNVVPVQIDLGWQPARPYTASADDLLADQLLASWDEG